MADPNPPTETESSSLKPAAAAAGTDSSSLGVDNSSNTNTNTNSKKPSDDAPAVRFASAIEEISADEPAPVSSAEHDQDRPSSFTEVTADQLREFTQSLHNRPLQERRMNTFQFEPFSLPPTRVSFIRHKITPRTPTPRAASQRRSNSPPPTSTSLLLELELGPLHNPASRLSPVLLTHVSPSFLIAFLGPKHQLRTAPYSRVGKAMLPFKSCSLLLLIIQAARWRHRETNMLSLSLGPFS